MVSSLQSLFILLCIQRNNGTRALRFFAINHGDTIMKRQLLTLAIVLTAITFASNAFAQTAECESVGHRSYPANEVAKTIAERLNVKTCDGARFTNALQALEIELVKTSASEELRESLANETLEKRQREIEAIREALN